MKQVNFLKLMGHGKRCWKYVKTKEDFANLKEFEDLFYLNFQESPKNNTILIPEIFHFVWLGPKEYPETSKKYLKSWLLKHPTWKVFFWSDREHDFLQKDVENIIITGEFLGEYKRLYEDSDNFGEKSDLIRLLALDKYGGVYLDHDMECRKDFGSLHRSYTFYGGLLTPGNPVIKRSAIVRNSIIGANKGEPILNRALKIAQENWDIIKAKYPGNDVNSVKKRVTLRIFSAFHQAVLERIKDPSFKGIIFPAGYFNEIEREFGIMANEDMVGAWYTEEMSHHEQYLKDRLHKMMKRMHFLIGILSLAVLTLIFLVTWLFVKIS